MTQITSLFPDRTPQPPRHTTGLLPSQSLKQLIRDMSLMALHDPIQDDQIQPASIDLRLGRTAYQVPASFLPNAGHRVLNKLRALSARAIDLYDGAVLERGCVYVIPLLEHVRFNKRMFGFANPKSSIGRLDVFTRLLTDHATGFNQIAEGYKGGMYAEVSPRTFNVRVRTGSRLLQIRIRSGSPPATDTGIRRLHAITPLVHIAEAFDHIEKQRIASGLALTANLEGRPTSHPVAYKAKNRSEAIDIDQIAAYRPGDFWEPLFPDPGRTLTLDPDTFYILASNEAVSIPPDHAAEMVPFNPVQGELRVHYAGFFDPGFGHGSTTTRAVLELRSHEIPFILEHGQIVARLVYERLTDLPDRLYGSTIGSSYQHQGLALSKHFAS